ncbi:GTPase [Actinacidiphila yeochonensis]
MAASPSARDPQDPSAGPRDGDPLTMRVDALGELLGLSRARISPEDLADSTELLARIAERRRLSLDHTVVALAGATGSGKSTLFNALAGKELSATGVRRPTTARPVSCAWQPERAAGLLDRLGIAPQDRYARHGLLAAPALPPAALPAQAGRSEVPPPPGPRAAPGEGQDPSAEFPGQPEPLLGQPCQPCQSCQSCRLGQPCGDGRAAGAGCGPADDRAEDRVPPAAAEDAWAVPSAQSGHSGLSARSGAASADGGGEHRAAGAATDTAAAALGAYGGHAVEDETGLEGLVLIDLPDHDSAVGEHREQVDRLLRLVDVVVWVLDPEKYGDAALHERYLRPLAGHADVTVLVLNQVDRLPGDSSDLVLDDLRRLLDEDGLAVGEHGEAGAIVLSASAATGQGLADLRAVLAQITGERAAAGQRLAADLDSAAHDLHPLYVGEGWAGLTDEAREDFLDRLADAVGATAVGQAAERDWGRAAWDACGTPWSRLMAGRTPGYGCSRSAPARPMSPERWTRDGRTVRPVAPAAPGRNHGTSGGGPGTADRAPKRGAGAAAGGVGAAGALPAPRGSGPAASRPVVEEAVRGLAVDAARGLPEPWSRAVGDAARRGGGSLPEALDTVALRARPGQPERPGWWSVAAAVQWLLLALVLAGVVCLAAVAEGSLALPWWPPLATAVLGGLGGPVVAAACRFAARGPARRYGQAAERRLRDAAADCGRAGVLEPVAAELMRYREVREQYAVVAGAAPVPSTSRLRPVGVR